jgi:hypothetical protein
LISNRGAHSKTPTWRQDASAIARIVNAAFLAEREFRPGDRTSAAEIEKPIQRDLFLVSEDADRALDESSWKPPRTTAAAHAAAK